MKTQRSTAKKITTFGRIEENEGKKHDENRNIEKNIDRFEDQITPRNE